MTQFTDDEQTETQQLLKANAPPRCPKPSTESARPTIPTANPAILVGETLTLQPGDAADQIQERENTQSDQLLVVDLGLHLGLALFEYPQRLCWYRSHHWSTTTQARRAIQGLMNSLPQLSHLVVEGGGPLASPWRRWAQHRGLQFQQIAAEAWRADLLRPSEYADTQAAKDSALWWARRAIAWLQGPKPTALRHDTAEAILIGVWTLRQLDWITDTDLEQWRRC